MPKKPTLPSFSGECSCFDWNAAFQLSSFTDWEDVADSPSDSDSEDDEYRMIQLLQQLQASKAEMRARKKVRRLPFSSMKLHYSAERTAGKSHRRGTPGFQAGSGRV